MQSYQKLMSSEVIDVNSCLFVYKGQSPRDYSLHDSRARTCTIIAFTCIYTHVSSHVSYQPTGDAGEKVQNAGPFSESTSHN